MYPLLNQSYFSQLILHSSFKIHQLFTYYFWTTTIIRAVWKTFFSLSGQPSSSLEVQGCRQHSCGRSACRDSAWRIAILSTALMNMSRDPCVQWWNRRSVMSCACHFILLWLPAYLWFSIPLWTCWPATMDHVRHPQFCLATHPWRSTWLLKLWLGHWPSSCHSQ